MKIFQLEKSDKLNKKFKIKLKDANSWIYFGARGMSDFTKHKDSKRRLNYEKRHRSRENWTSSGMNSAGFWSRWLLWNKPSLKQSIKNVESRFNIKIISK